jgi:hypothetical protein
VTLVENGNRAVSVARLLPLEVDNAVVRGKQREDVVLLHRGEVVFEVEAGADLFRSSSGE